MAGAPVGMGIPEYEADILQYEAKQHEGKLEDGNILISGHTEGSEERSLAEEIFRKAGAEDMKTTGEESAPS